MAIFLVLLLCVSSVLCGPLVEVDENSIAITQDFQELVDEHVDRLRNFSCKEPQVFVMSATELLKEHHISSDSVIHPHQSVVMRCMETSGCCPARKFCSPRAVEKITLVFRINNPFEDRSVGPIYQTIEVENHVECFCAKRRRK